jgi:asparagine synthase (glutamine-hydrolysing)
MGIAPLFYARIPGGLVFGSEIKAVLQHPEVDRTLDPAAFDQMAIFPGLVSPRTLFRNIRSLPPGAWLSAGPDGIRLGRYWDLDYPSSADDPCSLASEPAAAEELGRLLDQAILRRLQGEAEVGLLLSGGLDSSLLAGALRRLQPGRTLRAYAATFPGRTFDESLYQKAAAASFGITLVQEPFDAGRVVDELPRMIAHAEAPVRESYNVCNLALARAARRDGLKVLIGGDGADELFAGYPGHHADAAHGGRASLMVETGKGRPSWTNGGLRYERDYPAFSRQVRRLYSPQIRRALARSDGLSATRPRRAALRGRHVQHQRSYLDLKLRLADHLLGDHGDRMLYASGVEPRFPYLDRDVVAFARRAPPAMNLKDGVEKYLLRKVAARDVPPVLTGRRKYGFRGPGAVELLCDDRVRTWLAPERIRADGWFDPEVVQGLVAQASARAHDFNPHAEDDFLMLVLSFNIFLDTFQAVVPSVGGL